MKSHRLPPLVATASYTWSLCEYLAILPHAFPIGQIARPHGARFARGYGLCVTYVPVAWVLCVCVCVFCKRIRLAPTYLPSAGPDARSATRALFKSDATRCATHKCYMCCVSLDVCIRLRTLILAPSKRTQNIGNGTPLLKLARHAPEIDRPRGEDLLSSAY